jgi:hypothetical protein
VSLVEMLNQSRDTPSITDVVRSEVESNLESLSYVRHVSITMLDKETQMTITFVPNDRGNPPGKLADAELHFAGGPLDGLKLVGFAVWERRSGGRNVTFPARQYSVNGERRSFALLRPIVDATSQDRLRDTILEAFKAHEEAVAQAS